MSGADCACCKCRVRTLTCHAPVTFWSVELDFLVGTENPIRLLCRGKTPPLTLDEGCGNKQGVPFKRTGFVGFSRFFGAMLRN